MNVLFKNIPIGTKDYELAQFIESHFSIVSIKNMSLHVHIGSIEMLEKQDNFTHPVEQFGLMRISPPELAQRVIDKLNGRHFNNYRITVREYFDRSIENDPRTINQVEIPGFLEQRVQDRRMHDLVYSRHI